MRFKGLICVLMAAVLTLGAGCGADAEDDYVLYFPYAMERVSGDAIGRESYSARDAVQTPTADELLRALLQGPADETLVNPFPRGLQLRGCAWSETEDGILVVDFSDHYGSLADISLTVADYCIVLTLKQLDGVRGVEIITAGRRTDGRVLYAEDIMYD